MRNWSWRPASWCRYRTLTPRWGSCRRAETRAWQIHLHVDDCDAVMARAKAAGAEITMWASDHLHEERSGKFRDPFGHE